MLGGGSGSLWIHWDEGRPRRGTPTQFQSSFSSAPSQISMPEAQQGGGFKTNPDSISVFPRWFLGALLGGKFLCVDKMPPASPGPIQTEASQYRKVTKALPPIVFVVFFCCSFFFTPSFPLLLDHFHPPLSHALSHHASVFPLHVLSSAYVYFCKQTVVFIQFPFVFFGLFSSSNLLCSSPILSTYLPSRSAAGTLFPIRSVLSCLLDFCSPLCCTAAAFSSLPPPPNLADQKPGSYLFAVVGFIHLCIFLSPRNRVDGCLKMFTL